ncbi:class A beta-lactamase-related serine hydrolase [Kitasatospora sp. RB6PN24]|uniref:serine hydrolase n=1 Tax=Kitasatospora humi TaxID=2893891 RepID=UPI001E4A8E74|nr:serine hydrolase [Kitasatospora humi]MCC9307573.1 class A beta-lactamase-related serine hydrolase [Kitasatospora humi]
MRSAPHLVAGVAPRRSRAGGAAQPARGPLHGLFGESAPPLAAFGRAARVLAVTVNRQHRGRSGMTPTVDSVRAAVAAQVDEFVNSGGGEGIRSILVKTFGGPAITVEHLPDRVLPAASLAKMILGVALFEAGERGELDLDTRVRIGDLSTTMYPSVLQALDADTAVTVRELCGFSLVTSDNPAAEYVRAFLGQERIDAVLKDLRLDSTVFPAGFSERELGPLGRANTTTAADMLRLIEYIDRMRHLEPMRRYLVNYQRNDRIPARLDDDVPVRHKTGSLRGVVNDAGIILHPAVRIGMVVLTDGQVDNTRTAQEIGEVSERIVRIITAGAVH